MTNGQMNVVALSFAAAAALATITQDLSNSECQIEVVLWSMYLDPVAFSAFYFHDNACISAKKPICGTFTSSSSHHENSNQES